MTLFKLLTDAEKRGARFEIEGDTVTILGKSKLTPAQIETARRNKEMIREYIGLYNSAEILGKFVDQDPVNGGRLPEFEELCRQIYELEKTKMDIRI
jgi:hypothetical protein